MKKEILTEDILDKCKEYDQEARQEVFDRLDMTIQDDLPFAITERVFWWFADNAYLYEEPNIDDIQRVVEHDYLHRD